MSYIQDSLQRFTFDDMPIRGVIVHLDDAYNTIIKQHAYPLVVQRLLGEALIATALLTASIKFTGQMTLQFQSDAAVSLLVVKCTSRFELRGVVRFNSDAVAAMTDPEGSLLGEGTIVITVDNEETQSRYQSIVPIERQQTIASSLENYFSQSEQLATKIWLATNQTHVAGMLLQLMPEQGIKEREIFWEHAVKLGDTLSSEELLSLSNETLLTRLCHQEKVRIYAPENLCFKCTCTLAGMENAVRILGKIEAEAILKEKSVIIVSCDFCHKEYSFDRIDVEKIFYDNK